MPLLVVLAACGSLPTVGPSQGEVELEADPTSLDFADVRLGESAERVLTLRNHGTSDVLVADLRTPSPALSVPGFGTLTVGAGQEDTLTVRWTPVDVDELDGSLDLRVGTELDALSDLMVPVAGAGSGARLTLSGESSAAGTVSLGCSKTVSIDAQNTGDEDVVIESLELTGDSEFRLDDGTGAEPVLPIRIAPQASAAIDVVYTPTAEHDSSTTLRIESNDPIAPASNVVVDGQGHSEGSKTLRWTIGDRTAVTAIIQVNASAIQNSFGGFGDTWNDFLTALFDGLADADVPYRLAFVPKGDGLVVGDVPYIDDSFTVDEAISAAEGMIGEPPYGDNDQGLQTCLDAIVENEDWLIDESDVWRDSRLNLVVMNNDYEQSPRDAKYYVLAYEDYKDDFAVHGIAGTSAGCGAAVPSGGLEEAVHMTGGVFTDICSDWTDSVPTLVDSFLNHVETFVLEDDAVPWSIEVRIDDVQISTGWSYDAKTHAIVFDAATYPARGADVSVDYIVAGTCI